MMGNSNIFRSFLIILLMAWIPFGAIAKAVIPISKSFESFRQDDRKQKRGDKKPEVKEVPKSKKQQKPDEVKPKPERKKD